MGSHLPGSCLEVRPAAPVHTPMSGKRARTEFNSPLAALAADQTWSDLAPRTSKTRNSTLLRNRGDGSGLNPRIDRASRSKPIFLRAGGLRRVIAPPPGGSRCRCRVAASWRSAAGTAPVSPSIPTTPCAAPPRSAPAATLQPGIGRPAHIVITPRHQELTRKRAPERPHDRKARRTPKPSTPDSQKLPRLRGMFGARLSSGGVRFLTDAVGIDFQFRRHPTRRAGGVSLH